MRVSSVLFLSFLMHSCLLVCKEIVLDKIIARVNGRNILKSHLEEHRMIKNGEPFTLEEAVIDEITVQKAEELGAAPSKNDLEATFNAEKIAQGDRHMTDEEFEHNKLQSLGMNLSQYKLQLYRYLSSYQLIQALIAQKLIIPAQEINDYFKKNPVYLNAQYHIMVADIIDQKKIPKKPLWQDLGWFEIKDMDDTFQSIVPKLKPGQALSKPLNRNGRWQIILLKNYKPQQLEPLANRYYEIKKTLQEERQAPFVKDFIDNSKKSAYIIYP